MHWGAGVAALVLGAVVSSCSTAQSVGDVVIDDIGEGWKRSIDIEVSEEMAGFALALNGSDADIDQLPPAWMTWWDRGVESVMIVAISAGAPLRDDVSDETLATALGSTDLDVLGGFGSIDRAFRVFDPSAGGEVVMVFRETHLLVFDFSWSELTTEDQVEIVRRQLAAVPAYDPDARFRTMNLRIGLVVLAVLLFFAVRSSRPPLPTTEPDSEGEHHAG